MIGMEATSPGVLEMSDAVETWCRNQFANGLTGRGLIISGKFGCGKTRCLRSAQRWTRGTSIEAWQQGKWKAPARMFSFKWTSIAQLVLEENQQWPLEEIALSNVVFLDDIGAEEDRYRSGAATRLLGDVLGLCERKFFFMTTNVSPQAEGWSKRWDGRVEDRLLRSEAVTVNMYLPELKVESYAVWRLRQNLKMS